MSLSGIPKPLRKVVARRDGGCCLYCRLRQFGQGAVFHVNHILPRCHGGPTTADNLALQCPYCSLRKADKLTGVDPQTAEPAALFHPLRQNWSEHFAMLADGEIIGRTAVGRATIAALGMNDPIPRTARLLQRIVGILNA
jgi:hypothetical protein